MRGSHARISAVDSHGNMTKVPVPGDEANHHYVCTYDAWGRLVKVEDDSANTIAEYRYDGLGRRIRKFTPDGDNWRVREFYYNSAWQLLEVRKDTGKTRTGSPLPEPSPATTVHKQFVWSARYIDAPVLRDRDADADDQTGDLGYTDSGLEERLYYMTDANMNVTALVQGTPGDGDLGKVVERYVYDPYGKVTTLHGDADADGEVTEWAEDTTPDWDNRVLFCGYWRDGDTELDHVRRRFYHPTLGRWLTRDPLGYVDGMSLYEYVSSSPVAFSDPRGMAWIVGGVPPYTYYSGAGYGTYGCNPDAEMPIVTWTKSAIAAVKEKGPQVAQEIVNGLNVTGDIIERAAAKAAEMTGLPEFLQNVGDALSKLGAPGMPDPSIPLPRPPYGPGGHQKLPLRNLRIIGGVMKKAGEGVKRWSDRLLEKACFKEYVEDAWRRRRKGR